MNAHLIRRRLALLICPELGNAQTPVVGAPSENQLPVAPPHANQLTKLCDTLADHDNVTEWAISMRVFGRGSFFNRLRGTTPKLGKPISCSMDTFDQAMGWFSENWPQDLEWPADIPRPPTQKEDAA